MYKCLLVLASAAALKRPQRGLAVRGGELGLDADTAISVGTKLMGLSGIYAYVSPKENLDKYGVTKTDQNGLDNMRWAGAQQITTAAIFAADSERAIGLSGYYAAWNLIASAPATLATGFPKAAIYGWAAVCAVLGKKTLAGDVSPWALVAVWGLNGVQQHFMQEMERVLWQEGEAFKLKRSPSMSKKVVSKEDESVASLGSSMKGLALAGARSLSPSGTTPTQGDFLRQARQRTG